jgi:amidophosphoribosyltransferase
MCGIIGRVNTGNVAANLYTALYGLQHRGQDSTGIATYDSENNAMRIRKSRGTVVDALKDEKAYTGMDGDMGIGQVRYPTVGSDFERDAQPFMFETPFMVAMAHNGNVANYAELRKEIGKTRNIQSWCDVELILHLFTLEMIREKKDIFAAVENVMNQVNGSYSVVSLVEGEGMVAFRDPHAIRPMVMGKSTIASESVALDMLGDPLLRDIKPGECLLMCKDCVEKRCLTKGKPAHCMFEWVYFSRPDSVVEGKSVYDARFRLGQELAKIWGGDADVVMPVPDTARSCALGFSDESGIPDREGLIKNRYVGRTFIMPKGSRGQAVGLKFNPIKKEIKDKKVILVDDSIVRGNTSRKMLKLVRDAGAKEVHMMISSPPIRWPCFYGIDMTTKEELIASRYNDDEVARTIAEKIGADSVTYQTVEGLVRAIDLKGKLCLACLNGEYPTNVDEILEKDKMNDERRRPYEY